KRVEVTASAVDCREAGVAFVEHHREVGSSQQHRLGTITRNESARNLTQSINLRRRAALIKNIHIDIVNLFNFFYFGHDNVDPEAIEHATFDCETRAQQRDTLEIARLDRRSDF